MTAEPKSQPVVQNVLSTAPFYKSSLSAEKKLTKRINAVLTTSMLLGGVLVLFYFWPSQFGGFRESIFKGFNSPVAYLKDMWTRIFPAISDNIYVTIVEQ